MLSDEELRTRARQAAEEKVGFYIHLGVYVGVNAFLAGLWAFTSGIGSFPWFLFPLLGWGIGIIAHGIGTFRGPAYIEAQTEQEYQKLKRIREQATLPRP